MRTRLAFSLLLGLGLCALSTKAEAQQEPPKERYFYRGYDYGSQAEYNPLWVLINRGFDVLQIRLNSRNAFELEYKDNAHNVFDNLTHPASRISEEGTWKFFRTEVLPISYTGKSARWVPNYTLHLLGGGMTYSALREWYEAHDVPLPGVLSATTVLTAAFINETIENKGVMGRNTDCIADFYFFDIGGIILFSFDSVNRFFSHEVILADWSLQPAITFPGYELHNHGNYFSAKWPIPFYPKLRAFSYFGMASLFGLSYKFDNEYSVSAAGGTMSTRLTNDSTQTVENVVRFVPSGGLFVDRNNSLLSSLVVSDMRQYFINFNLYPGALTRTVPWLGMWTAVDKDGEYVVGLSSVLGFGAGFSSH